jgi:TolA-binding protein
VAIVGLLMLSALPALAARQAKVQAEAGGGDFEASRLLDKANELLASGESERGIKMLETVIEQYPNSQARFPVYLALGRHYAGARDYLKAVAVLSNLKELENAAGEVQPAERDLYLEGLYLMGTAYFQSRNYGSAFTTLRKIVTQYPNTVWANQAYYYIGMCHFVQQNWSKAIESLNLVGTFVDSVSNATDRVEAGRRFYVKVVDKDLAVLGKLGSRTFMNISTPAGDREKIECIPLGAGGDTLIGSISTEVGSPRPDDGVLQVRGGDTIHVRYTDANAADGTANVLRDTKAQVVSTGVASFTLGDYESTAAAAFIDQNLFLSLFDTDLDISDGADSATVHLVSRYKEESEENEPSGAVDLKKLLDDDPAKRYRVRDESTVRLAEIGQAPVHTGRFTGRVMLRAPQPGQDANRSDDVLTCAEGDEIVMTYTDERSLAGDTPVPVSATIQVVGEIDTRPRASQDVVADPVIKARKYLVEASAYLELARIFKSMGLLKGAKLKAAEGLERVDFIIRTSSLIPGDLKQQAFKTKWELHMATEDYGSAIATCSLFNKLYPDSPLVDEALMGIARIRLDNKEYQSAIGVLNQIIALSKSLVKAEAQFRIAEASEKMTAGRPEGREMAIRQYKLCAERYPESEFAGQSLAKLVDYHVEMRDFAQAGELLAQVFQDHPDASFLDAMLLKWVLVAYSSGDYAKAREKCALLLFEYPGSPYAEKAKQIMPKIDAKLKSNAGTPAGGSAQ